MERLAALARPAALAVSLLSFAGPAAADALARADAAWARRAEGHDGARAQPGPIREAIALYREALAAEPERLEIHWKLVRALWFAGDFATASEADERADYLAAKDAARRTLDVLAARVGGRAALDRASPEALRELVAPADRSDVAHFYFWHAVSLGAWAQLAGLLAAVREGVAGRLHEATLRSIALDPDVEQGGAVRLLARLHSQLPHVPLLSGWVDHAQAIPLAERAVRDWPAHPGNRFLLALELLARAPERRGEAVALLEETARLAPRGDHLVEDTAMRITAREELDGIGDATARAAGS